MEFVSHLRTTYAPPPEHLRRGSGNCKPPTHQLCTPCTEVQEFVSHLRTTYAPRVGHLRTSYAPPTRRLRRGPSSVNYHLLIAITITHRRCQERSYAVHVVLYRLRVLAYNFVFDIPADIIQACLTMLVLSRVPCAYFSHLSTDLLLLYKNNKKTLDTKNT